jgi:hypothetical protein
MKHVIIEQYAFTPSTKTIVVTGKYIRAEQLLLITNVTRGTVVYNFSDPSLLGTITNTVSTTTGLETTTIVLTYNTASHSSTDKLAIMVEETYTEITPNETLQDPVGKLRVSQPQSLIDTDFEYGTQPTKWESISLLNNRPSAFYDVTAPTVISNVTSSTTTVTISMSNTTGLVAGQPIFIIGTLDIGNSDGWWLIDTVSTNVSITYKTFSAPTQVGGTLYDPTKTYLYAGTFFTGSGIPTSGIVANGSIITVTTTNAHGLTIGNHVFISGTTGLTGVNGTWQIATTPTNTTFTITSTISAGTATLTAGASATLYTRTQGFITHRAFDGGVQFSNQLPYHGYQVIRQTRRYFRYQSGKGIQFSTGSIMKPAAYVDTMSNGGSGTTITVNTRFPHGLSAGTTIKVSGCDDSAYNGTFTVVTAPTLLQFTYTATSTPATYPATSVFSGNIAISPSLWFGSKNRIGMFDQQNGFFYEYDGENLYAVKRSSTQQLGGYCSITNGSPTVTGTLTTFSTQIKPGDMVVIRGQSYTVLIITSDTSMQIYPEYKGITATNVLLSKTIDIRTRQSNFNIDKVDGTGASGYNADLTRMQMFYMDYTWYGAGAIRFGFKNNRGEIIYVHRIPNNNVNTEAYMRSGNLPARYETNTQAYYSYLTATLASSATTGATFSLYGYLDDWPSTGTVVLNQASVGGTIEFLTYTAKTLNAITAAGYYTTTFTIGARAQTGGAAAAATFTVTGAGTYTPGGTAPIMVTLSSPVQSSTISHWGSSVIMDGRYDDDKSLVFNVGQNTAIANVTAGTRYALISLRVAPSVDNGITGLLGSREIINRMQLIMRQMDAYTTQPYRIDLILNGRVASGSFIPVGGSSLCQYALHDPSTTISGGESIFSFFTNSAGVTQQELTLVRDIGTSILGGGTSLTCPTTNANKYPDGPDIVTVCATVISTSGTNSINARISWTEAQA